MQMTKILSVKIKNTKHKYFNCLLAKFLVKCCHWEIFFQSFLEKCGHFSDYKHNFIVFLQKYAVFQFFSISIFTWLFSIVLIIHQKFWLMIISIIIKQLNKDGRTVCLNFRQDVQYAFFCNGMGMVPLQKLH